MKATALTIPGLQRVVCRLQRAFSELTQRYCQISGSAVHPQRSERPKPVRQFRYPVRRRRRHLVHPRLQVVAKPRRLHQWWYCLRHQYKNLGPDSTSLLAGKKQGLQECWHGYDQSLITAYRKHLAETPARHRRGRVRMVPTRSDRL